MPICECNNCPMTQTLSCGGGTPARVPTLGPDDQYLTVSVSSVSPEKLFRTSKESLRRHRADPQITLFCPHMLLFTNPTCGTCEEDKKKNSQPRINNLYISVTWRHRVQMLQLWDTVMLPLTDGCVSQFFFCRVSHKTHIREGEQECSLQYITMKTRHTPERSCERVEKSLLLWIDEAKAKDKTYI